MVEKTPGAFVNNFLRNLQFRRVPCLRSGAGAAACALIVGAAALAVPKAAAQAASDTPSKTTAKSSAKAAAANPSKNAASKIAAIKSFRIIQEKSGPALEILATHPLIPAIQQISDPTRLVIDLPNARLDTQQKRLSVLADQITSVRADQFQANPPVARIVVDLLAPRTFTWSSAGNRLVVNLGKNPTEPSHSPFQAPSVASLAQTPQPVVKAVRAAGPLGAGRECRERRIFVYSGSRHGCTQFVERRRAAGLSRNNALDYAFAEQAQPAPRYEHGRT